jgi:hypothetical protein
LLDELDGLLQQHRGVGLVAGAGCRDLRPHARARERCQATGAGRSAATRSGRRTGRRRPAGRRRSTGRLSLTRIVFAGAVDKRHVHCPGGRPRQVAMAGAVIRCVRRKGGALSGRDGGKVAPSAWSDQPPSPCVGTRRLL